MFLQLTLYHFDEIIVLFRPGGKDGIFQKLLGDGAGALLFFAKRDHKLPARPGYACDVDAVMLVETLVLYGDEGFSQMFRNQIPVVDLDAV